MVRLSREGILKVWYAEVLQRGTPKQGSTPKFSKGFFKCTISREGTQGNWAPRNAFSVEECRVVVELRTLPSLAVIRIFEYL